MNGNILIIVLETTHMPLIVFTVNIYPLELKQSPLTTQSDGKYMLSPVLTFSLSAKSELSAVG
jgi:hypothetical protein